MCDFRMGFVCLQLNCSTKLQNVSNEFVSGAIFDFKTHMTSNTTSHRCSPTTIASYDEMGRLVAPGWPERDIFPSQFPGFYGRRLRVVTKHVSSFVLIIHDGNMCVYYCNSFVIHLRRHQAI